MSLTFEELKARLARLEETTLMELLDLCSEDLVERFQDIIENDIERYEAQVQETED